MASKKRGQSNSRDTMPKAGDRISMNNQGQGSALAAGRRAFAAVFRLEIHDVAWLPVVLALTGVGGLLSIILWFVIPRPAVEMTKQFNIAVASFLVQDENGRSVAGNDGYRLAEYVKDQIFIQFSEMNLHETVTYEIWGPDQVKPLPGKDQQERRIAAEALATKINAHILIYGVVIANGNQSLFKPEFYINSKGFWQASEITGTYEMGSGLLVSLPLKNSIMPIENKALAGRVKALDLITLGLAYSSVNDYQSAASYFEKAAAEPRWLEQSGKEVAYLLIGNTYVGWASKVDDEQYLAAAEKNYSEALRIKPDYGRGFVGLANVVYLESLGSLKNPTINLPGLEKAETLARKAFALENQPASANIPAKAHFILGQIDWARYQAKLTDQDWAESAKQEFLFVTNEYEAGNTVLDTYAAHAYLRLGLIEYVQNRTDQAVENSIRLIQKAISLAPPFYRGEYTITLGNVYKNTGQKDEALKAYADAISIAESQGDAESLKRYQEFYESLK